MGCLAWVISSALWIFRINKFLAFSFLHVGNICNGLEAFGTFDLKLFKKVPQNVPFTYADGKFLWYTCLHTMEAQVEIRCSQQGIAHLALKFISSCSLASPLSTLCHTSSLSPSFCVLTWCISTLGLVFLVINCMQFIDSFRSIIFS